MQVACCCCVLLADEGSKFIEGAIDYYEIHDW